MSTGSKNTIVALIWAMTNNRVIGRNNQLPWSLKTDMQFFVDSTRGKPCIMGRKQFDSMDRALPGRLNIVISRNPDYARTDALVVDTMDKAIELAHTTSPDEIMIIGGAEIYALALPLADRLYMTQIDVELKGDIFFPEFDISDFSETSRQFYSRDAKNDYDFTIRILERITGGHKHVTT